jgi:hypothetical protein
MNPGERALIRVTAALLRAAGMTHWLSAGLIVVAAASIAFGAGNRTIAIAMIVVGLVATYYRIRISFDARLFDDVIAERLTTADLDQALSALSLAPAGRPERPWTDRCRGAKRLVAIYAVAVTVQGIGAILVWR